MEKPEWLGRMETVLEVLNEGVVIADDRHRILFANSRFVEMTGIPLEDLVGFDASRFYSSEEWNFLTQQIEIAFHAGHNRYAFVLPRKDGSRLPVIISSRTPRERRGPFGDRDVRGHLGAGSCRGGTPHRDSQGHRVST